jgi:hypothetical protein
MMDESQYGSGPIAPNTPCFGDRAASRRLRGSDTQLPVALVRGEVVRLLHRQGPRRVSAGLRLFRGGAGAARGGSPMTRPGASRRTSPSCRSCCQQTSDPTPRRGAGTPGRSSSLRERSSTMTCSARSPTGCFDRTDDSVVTIHGVVTLGMTVLDTLLG